MVQYAIGSAPALHPSSSDLQVALEESSHGCGESRALSDTASVWKHEALTKGRTIAGLEKGAISRRLACTTREAGKTRSFNGGLEGAPSKLPEQKTGSS